MTQAIILCGGLGTRMRDETEFKPKPMVAIGSQPILWHIMSHYRAFGVRDFILCLGYRGEIIRDYFLNFRLHSTDVRVDLADGAVTLLGGQAADWRVTLVDTGLSTMTGARVRRASRFIEEPRFFATYGDGLANVDLSALMAMHVASGKGATVTAVRPPSRFGDLEIEDGVVRSFIEKPQVSAGWINGGFFVFETETVRQFPDNDQLSLEVDVLEDLASTGQLGVFQHPGFWQCMDTPREMQLLNTIWAAGDAPWKTW